MSTTDERLKVVDEGILVVVGGPPCPPAPDVDLTPILDRIGDLEAQMVTLTQSVDDVDAATVDNATAITAQDVRLSTVEGSLWALLGGIPTAWIPADPYAIGDLVTYLGALYVASVATTPGAPPPDNGPPWVHIVSFVDQVVP